jgi:predicted alternative tryptophan synthase beta-subunit
MRFKLYFNEQQQTLDINCLKDTHSDTILPDDVSQHVYFPIPNELRNEIHKLLTPLITDTISEEYIQIQETIKALNDKKRELINDLRAKINPKIMAKCEQFRQENAEHFI